jgi:hypothetical protein
MASRSSRRKETEQQQQQQQVGNADRLQQQEVGIFEGCCQSVSLSATFTAASEACRGQNCNVDP